MSPFPTARRGLLVLGLSLLLALTALPAQATQAPSTTSATTVGTATGVYAGAPAADRKRKKRKPVQPRPRTVTTTSVGRPAANYVFPASSVFSYPNRSKKERLAIRNRVLLTVRSTWGGPRTRLGTPMPGNGKIRMATWSFDDWKLARALVAARNRGVSVQVVAAADANKEHKSWKWLKKRLGANLYRPGYPVTRETYSFARACRGSCRGFGGTQHAKFFLFDKVGLRRARSVSVQTSANLTTFAASGQWNQAQVSHSSRIWGDHMKVFREMRLGRPVARQYHVQAMGNAVDYFFPRPRTTAATDPVMQMLNRVVCRGALSGGTPRGYTKVRVVQYAIYGNRGEWIARKLRYLHERGCSVKIIYAVTSRPVLRILRNPSGRGKVPMRQSVIKNAAGEIVKYNHNKWMTITGRWGTNRSAWLTFSGSANWADLSLSSDEQMQRISSSSYARVHLANFAKTWRQKSSRKPASGRIAMAARMPETGRTIPDLGPQIRTYQTDDTGIEGALDAEGQPQFGTGELRHMSPFGG